MNKTDSTGHWFGLDDAIAAGVGAITGVAGQYVSDVVQNYMEGKRGGDMFKPVSSWESYVGAGIGGAAGGMTLLYTANSVAAGAVTGGATTLSAQLLEKATGKADRSFKEIGANTLLDTGMGALIGKAMPGVSKVTAGRNSFQAVYKSGLTKLSKGTASTMNKKVLAKGTTAMFVGGLGMDAYYGVKQYAYPKLFNNDNVKTNGANTKMYFTNSKPTSYWMPAN